MTATESSVTRPPVGLVAEAERRYGLAIEIGRRLEGGYENDLWHVDGGGRKLVLRVEVGGSNVEGVRWEHDLVRALAEDVPEVVAPIRALDGATFFLHEGRAVSLFPFVSGVPADPESDWREAALLLARLHRVAGGIPPGARPGYAGLRDRDWTCPPLDVAPASIRARHGQISEALDSCRDFVGELELPAGPIHGDYWRGNVLVEDGSAVGLVDWREAHVDFFAYELANGVWEFCKREDDDEFDRVRGGQFVSAYREAGGLVPPEHDGLLVPLIRCRRLLEVIWALRRTGPSPGDWEYHLHNLRALDRLADG